MTSQDMPESPRTSEVSTSGWLARVFDFLRDVARIIVFLAGSIRRSAQALWDSPIPQRVRRLALNARSAPWSGASVIIVGAVITTLFILALDHIILIPNHGSIYLPVIAFIAYYWDWRHGAIAAILDLFCVYFFFAPPAMGLKPLNPESIAQLLTDAAVILFVLAVVQLAVKRRALAEREAARFASLTSVGVALSGELNEERLLRLIARTACDLTGAGFAAFTLRPIDTMGRPLTASRGELFYLAAVVGVTPQEEALFKHMPLGGEGLLAPIFRFGTPVRVADASAMYEHALDGGAMSGETRVGRREKARAVAQAFSTGSATTSELRGVGVPRGHPVVRSFLGAPLLDRRGDVRGGLLLGHSDPDRFTAEDERLLRGLAAQAATALENARLYRAARSQAQELDVIFESIADGVSLVDTRGQAIRENGAAKALRDALTTTEDGDEQKVAREPDKLGSTLSVVTVSGEQREYIVTTTPVSDAAQDDTAKTSHANSSDGATNLTHNLDGERPAAVVVWHDVTESQQLIAERRARAEADTRRAILQVVIDELPSGMYLVYGPDARLALANRAAYELWGAEWRVGQPMVEFLRECGAQLLRPDGQPMPMNELATLRAARTGEAVRHHQETILRPNGIELPVLFNAVSISSDLLRDLGSADLDSGNLPGHIALVVLQDMTKLKESERIKDEFIAMAAHELRTPMAAVKGYTEMLQRGVSSGQGAALDEWQNEALESIDLAITRLVDLTNDLLDVSRLQASRMELHCEPHDLVALTKRVARRFQVTTRKNKIITESPQDYVVAIIDAPRMEQVVGNLLSNAIKYSPDGGDVLVTVIADEQVGVARVSVRDQGIGIPALQQEQLFERFARADNARELGIGGTGLGLFLCRELLVHMDGRIWIESQEGHGTTVSFEVPLHKDDDVGE